TGRVARRHAAVRHLGAGGDRGGGPDDHDQRDLRARPRPAGRPRFADALGHPRRPRRGRLRPVGARPGRGVVGDVTEPVTYTDGGRTYRVYGVDDRIAAITGAASTLGDHVAERTKRAR